jgi:hypothetical protein
LNNSRRGFRASPTWIFVWFLFYKIIFM